MSIADPAQRVAVVDRPVAGPAEPSGGRLRESERTEPERLRVEEGLAHRVACRALGVSEPWYHKWRDRPPTEREMRRQHLAEEIEEIFRCSGDTYGSPKVFIELVNAGAGGCRWTPSRS